MSSKFSGKRVSKPGMQRRGRILICMQFYCGQSMTFQHMRCFLDGVRKASLHVHTAIRKQTTYGWSMGRSTATWGIVAFCLWTTSGAKTRSVSTTRQNIGRLHNHWLENRCCNTMIVLTKSHSALNQEKGSSVTKKRDGTTGGRRVFSSSFRTGKNCLLGTTWMWCISRKIYVRAYWALC